MYLLNKLKNPIMWNRTSEEIYNIIIKFIKKNKTVIEIGSGSGHLSYFIAKLGYKVTLNDIRNDVLFSSRKIYESCGLTCTYINKSLHLIRKKYDLLFSTGLIQCFKDEDKEIIVKKFSKISHRVLLFYPDTLDKNKVLGKNTKNIPGVDDAIEYDTSSIPKIMNEFFSTCYFGELSPKKTNLTFRMFWMYGENHI